MNRKLRRFCLLLFLGLLLPVALKDWQGRVKAQDRVDFVRDIQPIFRASCAPCHLGEKAKAEPRLDSRAQTLKLVVPGNRKDSRLLHRLLGLNGEPRMPLGREALSKAQLDLLGRWI